jgi:hypothetical protein
VWIHGEFVAHSLCLAATDITHPICASVLLKAIGLSEEERNQIEGLTTIQMRGSLGLTEAQLSTRAIVRLAVDPPAEVGSLQRRTSNWLLRP